MGDVVYTVGHSTRSLEQLVALLAESAIGVLMDVRTVPRSRRRPHFAAEQLAESLPAHGVRYRHEPQLGGFRRPCADSPNRGWTHRGFRGYADHMATPAFHAALEGLERVARAQDTCVMCAEAQWWRCHRRLISDALVVRGWRVLHLGLGADPVEHELTPFAVVGPDLTITYPPAQAELELTGEAVHDS